MEQEFREPDKIAEAWIGVNLKVLCLTCILTNIYVAYSMKTYKKNSID